MRPLPRILRNSWLPVCMALAGSAILARPSPAESQRSSQAAIMASGNLNPAQPSELQLLQVDRSYKGRQAVGRAVLKPPLTLEAIRARHERLAAARAWVSLAEQNGQKGDWAGAVACAQAGRPELGDLRELYPHFGALDQAGTKWRAAEDQVKQGQVKEATAVMLDILKLRAHFYVRYYSQEIDDRAQTAELLQLRVDRTYKDQRAVGRVVLKPLLTPENLRAKHERLAGARAWLSLAEQSTQAGDWSGAVECAQAGRSELGELRELGARLGVMDHSDMHWFDATLQVKKGQFETAAPVMLRVLKEQTSLYVRYYSQEVAD